MPKLDPVRDAEILRQREQDEADRATMLKRESEGESGRFAHKRKRDLAKREQRERGESPDGPKPGFGLPGIAVLPSKPPKRRKTIRSKRKMPGSEGSRGFRAALKNPDTVPYVRGDYSPEFVAGLDATLARLDRVFGVEVLRADVAKFWPKDLPLPPRYLRGPATVRDKRDSIRPREMGTLILELTQLGHTLRNTPEFAPLAARCERAIEILRDLQRKQSPRH